MISSKNYFANTGAFFHLKCIKSIRKLNKVKNSFSTIHNLMNANGISKKQLAEIAGVQPSAVTKWSNGGAIRLKYLHKIAQHFNVETQHLLANSITVNQSENEADWKFRALDAERRLKAVHESLSLILQGTQKLQESLK